MGKPLQTLGTTLPNMVVHAFAFDSGDLTDNTFNTVDKTVSVPMSLDKSVLIPQTYGDDGARSVSGGSSVELFEQFHVERLDVNTMRFYGYVPSGGISGRIGTVNVLEIPVNGTVTEEQVWEFYTGGGSDDVEERVIDALGTFPDGSPVIMQMSGGTNRHDPAGPAGNSGSRVYMSQVTVATLTSDQFRILFRGDSTGDGYHRLTYSVIVL